MTKKKYHSKTFSEKLLRRRGRYPIKKWKVKSKSNPGEYHLVEKLGNGSFRCDCIGYTTHHNSCRHIKIVKGQLLANRHSL